jgi:uncharacterized protein (DUF58 family)
MGGTAPVRSWPRPAALSGQALVLVAMAGAIYVISRTTGSGWLLVLFSGVVAVLVLGAALPARGLTGVELEVQGPDDATAGSPVMMNLSVGGRAPLARLRFVEPPGEGVRLDGRGAGDVRVVPSRRGVLHHVDIELRGAAPFGLVWWRRSLPVTLRRPLQVGPEPLACPVPSWSPDPGQDATAVGRTVGAPGDLVRSVRDYVDGDALRLVSWQATARQGRIMVKELEAPETARLAIVVDLRGSEDDAEETARRAAGMANAALAQGLGVLLLTCEKTGPCAGPVASPVEVGRRLARAVAGAPPAPPQRGVHVVLAGGR